MYSDGGFGVESGKVLLHFSEEVEEDQRRGGHTHLWPGQVVEVTHLTLPTRLRERERELLHVVLVHTAHSTECVSV